MRVAFKLALVALFATLCGSSPAAAGTRLGPAPSLPAGSTLVADGAAARSMQIMVALRPTRAATLAASATAVSTPGSREYRRYLSVSQFARRFGASDGVITAVERSLRSHGLRPSSVSANHLAIFVDASPAALSRAFSAELVTVRLPSGRTATANRLAPRVDSAIAPDLSAIIGLDTLGQATTDLTYVRRNLLPAATQARRTRALSYDDAGVRAGGPQPCRAAVEAVTAQHWGPAWTANEVAYAYQFGALYRAGDKGQGVTVGLYEQEPDLASDVTAFQRCYHTHATVTYIKVGKGPGTGAGSGEASGDIEQLISFAPKAHILVYHGPANIPGSADPILSAMVSQDRARVISTSWGGCEAEDGRRAAAVDNDLLEEAAIQGQTFVAASGDDGAEDCYESGVDENRTVSVDSPGSSPWATDVGGTLLSSISPTTQTVWNNVLSDNLGSSGAAPGSGGGGVSSLWKMPAYQAQAPAALNVINAESSGVQCAAPGGMYCRETPDVSADADPADGYATYYDGQWQTWGGTSAATPVWAALFALADASRACAGRAIGFANPALYALAGSAFINGAYSDYFQDVTGGENDVLDLNGGQFAAGLGYDMASGLGTPRAAALVTGLCDQTLRLRVIHAVRRMRLGHAQSVQLRVSAAPVGITGITYHATHLPRGLTLDPATGQVSGAPRRVGSFDVTFWATGSGQYVTARIGATWIVRA